MDCPRCQQPMFIALKGDIEIDHCPNCQGIWLDKGELEKIIGAIGEYYSNKKNYEADYEAYDYGDPEFNVHHPNRRKKSFLTHFFDWDVP
jgi:uncharacterized protein